MQNIEIFLSESESSRNSKLRRLSRRFPTLIWRPEDNLETPGLPGRVDSTAVILSPRSWIVGTYNSKRYCFVYIFILFLGRFGEDSLEVADSSFVLASSYLSSDDDDNEKAKKYLEDAISLYMKYKGPYDNSTIKAQVSVQVLAHFSVGTEILAVIFLKMRSV